MPLSRLCCFLDLFRRTATAFSPGMKIATRARYSAVERANASSMLELWCSTGRVESDQLEVVISRSFVNDVTLESVVPAPASVTAQDDALVYSFALESLTSGRTLRAKSDSSVLHIVWRYRHNASGRVAFDVALAGEPSLRIQQWVLP